MEPITPQDYLTALPADRKEPLLRLRETLVNHLPAGFQETVAGGMLAYVVPHSLYPAGYHCNPRQPLPFINLALQKNFIALYHMGLYAMPDLLTWFQQAYPRHSPAKLDMGKSCLRFKKAEQIPYGLLGELLQKVTPEQWIQCYEAVFKNARKAS